MARLTPLQLMDLKDLPYSLQEWLRQVQILVGGTTGTIPWSNINFTGSSLADIQTRLFTALDFSGSNLTSLATRNHNDTQNKQGGTTNEFYHLTSSQSSKLTGVATSWTPTRTGWTDVGAPTVTARYSQLLNIVHFQIKVVPSTTVATVAGTSYTDLPIVANSAGIAGDGSMMNLTSLVGVGNCVIDVANSRCYVPTQGATGNTLTIGGWYEV